SSSPDLRRRINSFVPTIGCRIINHAGLPSRILSVLMSVHHDPFTISTVSLRPQLILQARQHFTRAMVVEPSSFVSLKPAGTPTAEDRGSVGVEVFVDEARDELPQLR